MEVEKILKQNKNEKNNTDKNAWHSMNSVARGCHHDAGLSLLL